VFRALLLLALLATGAPVHAQQTGAIIGKVVDNSGGVLPGVTVEASSPVLPTPRVTITGADGEFRLPALAPGNYTVTFTLSGMQTVTIQALVQLAQDTAVNATMGIAGVAEEVTVTATASLIDRESATIKSGVSNEQIMALPVGQEYRDLVKLIPGVQYTQDQTRGPSAGGSGQDNVYQFDGVNVTMPLFGTLSAEPASHDIAQVTTIKGGARAVDFDRSGGFTIDSVSKSGTNAFSGLFSYQLQNDAMSADLESGSLSRYEQDRTWMNLSVGGPVFPERLFFYGSYYRPERTRDNRANLYGELPRYESVRNEGFGKLTYTPTSSVLLNFSYRHSDREDTSSLFASNAAPTTGTGDESLLRIGTAEGSWILNPRSHLTFKYTYFALETLSRPDFISDAVPTSAVGATLNFANLDQQGRLQVPSPRAGEAAYNAFIQPFIDRYGYVQDGVHVGGAVAGYGLQFNNQDFFRNSGQIGYNISFGTDITHDLHVGYQRYVDSEELERSANGWGDISIPGGRTNLNGVPIFFTARYQALGSGVAPTINSEYHSQSFEANDSIRWKDVTLNLGVLISNDTLYGQGLREDSSTLSGYVAAPGNKYEMYDIPFSKMIQPRLGATWAYNGSDTIYGGYARYNPAASSLPRAASWDRNILGAFIDAHFDANGVLFAAVPVASSSGKLFVPDLTPRTIDEFLIGTARQFTPQWSARLYGRYREASHFWEDTNNNARVAFNPPAGIPRELYIPNLSQQTGQIGSGSSYVIAELDGAYTKYQEVTLESEWRGRNAFVRGSYTWSHYYGNFDQDGTTGDNDQNIFIGSSNIADGAGRQMWDFKDGDLHGDRPHMLKVYGYYMLPWTATVGTYFVAQSGHPWESWNYEIYRPLVGTSTSDTIRYAEPAGSRRTDAHWQMDLNYTQNFRLTDRYNVQVAFDLFNVFDNQTGYDPQPSVHSSVFGQPRKYFDPRRLQIAARFQF
jgi:hypothetical protein